MRYHWGLGVGHTCSQEQPATDVYEPDVADEPPVGDLNLPLIIDQNLGIGEGQKNAVEDSEVELEDESSGPEENDGL